MSRPALERSASTNGTPPEDEARLLNALINQPDALGQLLHGDRGPLLAPDDFEDWRCGAVFGAELDLADNGSARPPEHVVPIAEILERRRQLDAVGGPAFLDSLRDVTGRAESVRYFAKRILKRAIPRRVAAAAAADPEAVEGTLRDLLERLDALSNGSGPAVEPMLRTLAEVELQTVRFLWPPYIPAGKITLLEGNAGTGKSFLALNSCARLSRGLPFGPLDDGASPVREPGSAIYLAAEDDPGDTLKPRLLRMGGDPARVQLIEGTVRRGNRVEGFDLRNLDLLETALDRTRAELVVVDPIFAFTRRHGAMIEDDTARELLTPLKRIAGERGVSLLLIRHLRKAAAADATHAGAGSVAYSAAARSILLAGRDPEDPDGARRVLVHSKSNLAKDGQALLYEIAGGPAPEDVAELIWRGRSEATAQDLIGVRGVGDTPTRTKEAVAWLDEALPPGAEVESRVIAEAAEAAGISSRTLYRARKELRIAAVHVQEHGTGKVTGWSLRRPACQP